MHCVSDHVLSWAPPLCLAGYSLPAGVPNAKSWVAGRGEEEGGGGGGVCVGETILSWWWWASLITGLFGHHHSFIRWTELSKGGRSIGYVQ